MQIKFGTSGWRDVIADNFTFDNVKLVTQAIADYVTAQSHNRIIAQSIIVGYDTRFLSEEFAKTACCVLAANGIKALYCKRDTPTPTIAHQIIRRKLAGGINFTASHNPPEYNGLKFSPSWGGPALPEETKEIERRITKLKPRQIKEISFEDGKRKKLIEEINPEKEYIDCIKKLVDLKKIKKAKLKIGIDLLYGTSRGYLDKILKEIGCEITVLNDRRDVLFGGYRPEPDEHRLRELKGILLNQKLNIGLSCDGDADRFGIIDSDGTYITPNEVIAVLFYYLVKSRSWKGIVVRSVMTTHFIDAIAKKYNIEVKETPVGFKFIGEIMVKNPDRFIIGGEESGGLTIRGHVPEKDGILVCLLIAEMVASEGKSIRGILNHLYREVGTYITKRINFSVTEKIMSTLKNKLNTSKPAEFASIKVKDVITTDGHKFILEDGSWVGIRLSGTEPVVRLYLESDTPQKLETLKNASQQLIQCRARIYPRQ